jgi:predicted Zn-dependent protease
MKQIIVFLILFQLFSCKGQDKDNCSKENAFYKVTKIQEVAKDISLYKNSRKKIIFEIDEDTYNKKQYFVIKEEQDGEFHNSVWNIFYVDKKDCSLYYYDTVSGNLFTIEKWRLLGKNKIKNMEEIKFTDLFNEGSIIKFSPKDLDKNTPEIQDFKKKLEKYEQDNLLIVDFDNENLSYLINNNTFFDSQYFINSDWIQYFITKYKVDVTNLNTIMKEAIEQEDYNAVIILLNNHYVVSKKDLEICSLTEIDSKEKIKEDKAEGYESYLVENSEIDNISKLLKSKYLNNHIEDKDGYTNLRKEKSSSSEILQKIKSGEQIEILDNTGDWFLVKTKEGKTGYIHKSRIKSGNDSNHPTSYLLYSRPDFSSFAQNIKTKGEIEYLHKVSGWDFVKVNGVTGYLATEEAKKEKEESEKKKFSFLAEGEDIKPEKKKGFLGGLFS